MPTPPRRRSRLELPGIKWPAAWDSARLAVLGGVMLVALAGMVLGLAALQREQQAASLAVAHTLGVLEKVAALEAHLQTAISDARGYVIGHDPADHVRSDAAAQRAMADVADLARLTADNPRQRAEVDSLRVAVGDRVDILWRIAGTVLALGPRAAPAPALLAAATMRAEQVRSGLADIQAEEQTQLDSRRRAVARVSERLLLGLIGCGLIIAAAITLMVSLGAGRRREQRHHAEILRLNAALEGKVIERTAALAASEARQRVYFEHSATGILIFRRQDESSIAHDDANPALLAILGRAREDVVGHTLEAVWPAADATLLAARMQACLETGRPDFFSLAVPARGARRTLDLALAPMPAAADGADGADGAGADMVVANVRDVTTERALAEQVVSQALAQARAAEREAAVFANSADILAVIAVAERDGAGALAYEAISPSFEKATGVRVADLLGAPPETWMTPEFAEKMRNVHRECVVTGAQVAWTATIPANNGNMDVEGITTPVRDHASGRVARLVETVRDVTERNAMVASMHQGRRMEAIGRVAAGIAHDFNNVLQAVAGSLDLIAEDLRSGTPAHDLALIAMKSARRGATLTRGLLGYTRREDLRPRPVALDEFLREMRALLGRTLAPTIDIVVDVADGMPPALTDAGLLQTALLNLAINAGHAMPGGGTLRLAASVTDCATMPVLIAVTDTGTGMDDATLARATEPFFSTKGAQGTGLGLSMVQGFAVQSGGALRVASSPGAGTRVELHLPAAASVFFPLVRPSAPARVPRGTILLVDDTEDVRVTTGAFLSRAGFDVVSAPGGEAALALLGTGQAFDGLVCDFALPGLNGVDLIAIARRARPTLPALVITGHAEVDATPFADVPVLRKPVARTHLIETLRAVMEAGGAPVTGVVMPSQRDG